VPVCVLARDVYAARRGGAVVGRDRATAARRNVDGLGEAIVRAGDDRRGGILPRQDGAIDYMRTLSPGGRLLVAGLRRSMFATVMIGALSALPTTGFAQDLGIEVGSAAPAAKVFTLDGKEADLAQYIGKTAIVMEFWATWCPNCKELEPTLVAAIKKYGNQVKFVGVAVSVNETPERVKAFVAKHGLPGDHYFD